jgi:hypothetical protein
MIESPTRERPTTPQRAKPRATEGVKMGRLGGEPPTRVYAARFLELPPALALAGLWLAGAALLGLCGLALYLVATTLAHVLAGV